MAGTGDESESGALGYRPALDGLRALAVVAVLLFHSGFSWARGGYLGVSAFFTLSGFLITTLLLEERRRTGTISLTRFWARRFRRLLPAALVAIALGALWVATSAPHDVAADFRVDGLAALFDVANWRFVFADRGYLDTFTLATGTTLPQSPVLHFWSLAIEEQFYLLFPPLLLAIAVLARGRRRLIASVLGVFIAASTLLGVVLGTGGDNSRAYFGTDTRAAELLIGAMLAVALAPRVAHDAVPRSFARLAALAGPLALAVLVAGWSTIDHADPALFRGGLLLHATLTAVVITALLVAGPLRSALSWRPLVGLGRISYGVYLYHWVVFQQLDARRTDLAAPQLFALRCAITLALASVSYFALEQPIRLGTGRLGTGRLGTGRLDIGLRRPRGAIAPAIGAVTALMAVILIATATLPPATTVFSAVGATNNGTAPVASRRPAGLASFDDVPSPPALTEPAATATTTAAGAGVADAAVTQEVRRVLVVGDSVALTLGRGIERWGTQHSVSVWNIGRRMCGLGRGRLLVGGTEIGPSQHCESWPLLYGTAVDAFDPNVVVVLSPVWDAMPHRIDAWPDYRFAGDPVYDEWLYHEYVAAAGVLTARDARVVWLDVPCVEGRTTNSTIDALNTVIDRLAVADPNVDRVSLAAVLCEPAHFTNARADDGFHFTDPGADQLAAWLGPQLLARPDAAPPQAPRPSMRQGAR